MAARVLMEQVINAQEAIETVREQRKGSLSDEFVAWRRAEEKARLASEG